MNKIKLVVFQLLSFFFLVNGIKRFYFAINSKKMDCLSDYIKDSESNCWQAISTQENIFVFMANMQIFPFYAGFFVMVLFLILNIISRSSWIATSTIFILSFFMIKIVSTGYLNLILNSLGGLFAKSTFSKYLIESIVYSLTGLLILIIILRFGKTNKKEDYVKSK